MHPFAIQAAASIKLPNTKQAIPSLRLAGTPKTHIVPQLEPQMLISL